jgi:AraC-like DNA-binding protein
MPAVTLILAGVTDTEGIAAQRPRGLRQWHVQLDVAGSRWFSVGGERQEVRAGDLLLIEPNTPMFYDVVSRPAKTFWILFHPPAHWFPLLRWKPWLPGVTRLRLCDPVRQVKIQRSFEKILAVLKSGQAMAEVLAMHHLESLLLWRCHRWLPGELRVGRHPRIEEVIAYIVEHVAVPIRVTDLARVAGLSETRFTAVFKQSVGMAPMQYLTRYRMQRACTQLLSTNQLVKQISNEVGYQDVAQFSARFRRLLGVSPLHYRHSHHAGNTQALQPEKPLRKRRSASRH